jgi:hypothetical protein
MKLYKKKKGYKEPSYISNDLRSAYQLLLSQNKAIGKRNNMYAITINHTNPKHLKDFRFQLTNLLFNRINKDYNKSKEYINYLYVIEYPELISKGHFMPNNCDIHTHIVINTSLLKEIIEYYCVDVFHTKPYIDDITLRDDNTNYIDYLLKQVRLFTDDNYNYKILY